MNLDHLANRLEEIYKRGDGALYDELPNVIAEIRREADDLAAANKRALSIGAMSVRRLDALYDPDSLAPLVAIGTVANVNLQPIGEVGLMIVAVDRPAAEKIADTCIKVGLGTPEVPGSSVTGPEPRPTDDAGDRLVYVKGPSAAVGALLATLHALRSSGG